jgi:hypothetical protein
MAKPVIRTKNEIIPTLTDRMKPAFKTVSIKVGGGWEQTFPIDYRPIPQKIWDRFENKSNWFSITDYKNIIKNKIFPSFNQWKKILELKSSYTGVKGEVWATLSWYNLIEVPDSFKYWPIMFNAGEGCDDWQRREKNDIRPTHAEYGEWMDKYIRQSRWFNTISCDNLLRKEVNKYLRNPKKWLIHHQLEPINWYECARNWLNSIQKGAADKIGFYIDWTWNIFNPYISQYTLSKEDLNEILKIEELRKSGQVDLWTLEDDEDLLTYCDNRYDNFVDKIIKVQIGENNE